MTPTEFFPYLAWISEAAGREAIALSQETTRQGS